MNRRAYRPLPPGLRPGPAIAAAILWLVSGDPVLAASFPSDARVFFQTSGCNRAATIGDWYSTSTSASTARYSEFFVEVTESMSPATITIIDAESVDGGGVEAIDDEVFGGASDPTQFRLLSASGVTIETSPVFTAAGGDGQNYAFAPVTTGLYRIRSYTGTDQTPATADATYCNDATIDNDDDNGFRIQVNGTAAQDGLLGFLQTTYQQNTGGTINYQMYFLVGPNSTDTTLALRNFDLDTGGNAVYNRPPNAGGTPVAGTASGDGVWNGGGTLNAGQDSVTADNDLASGSNDAGTWGYRIENYTNNNQTIFEANESGLRLALTDTIPTRAGFFEITPSGTLATTIGNAVNHSFSVTNLFFTKDVINFGLANTSAGYTVQLYTDADCDGDHADGETLLVDNDGDGQVDSGLLGSAGSSVASACFILQVTPNAGASSSDTTQINASSLMDTKVGATVTTRTIEKTTLLPPSIAKSFSPDPVGTSQASTLTITLSNPNTSPLTGATFIDTFPSAPGQMFVATPLNASTTCGAGTLDEDDGVDPDNTLEAGDGSIRLSGGTIPASGSCTVTVAVSAATNGTYTNTIPAGGLVTSGGASQADASDTLSVNPPMTTLKSSAVITDPQNCSIAGDSGSCGSLPKRIPGAVIEYTIQVSNTGAVNATLVSVADPVPADTTYVDDSLVVDAVGCPDDEYPAGPASKADGCTAFGGIDADLGTVNAGSSRTVVFRVTIDN